MYRSSLERLSTAIEDARKRKYDEEILREKLRGEPYKMFNLTMKIKDMFSGYKSREYLGFLFVNKTSVLYLADDEKLRRKIWKTSPSSTRFGVIIHSFEVAAEENLLEKPMELLKFKIKVAKKDSDLYPGNVSSVLKRRWLRENIFDIDKGKETIRLLYPVREVLVF